MGAETVELETERLRLRRWRESDLAPFAALNADDEVMAHLGGPMSAADSEALARRIMAGYDAHGFGLAAVERTADGAFLGFTGLHHHRWYPGDVEIGWRLTRAAWGQGYATEAAAAWRDAAFGPLGLDRLISITTADNDRSLQVMRRLGMREWWRGEREGLDIVICELTREQAGAAGSPDVSPGPLALG